MKRLQQGVTCKPDDMSGTMFQWSVSNLARHGLISVQFLYDSYRIFEWELTLKGKAYLESNPKLYNPINWDKWFAIYFICFACNINLFSFNQLKLEI